MKFTIKLKKLKTIEKIDGYWKNEDYIELLELFDYNDAKSLPEAELLEMLNMAITEFDPSEAAQILLNYKLSEHLNKGQIENISHEMLLDKVAEEYPIIPLHYPLFNINQLLFKAYNGKFPKTMASVLDFELSFEGEIEINKEVVLRTLSDLLSSHSLLKRLFSEQLDSDKELKDAEGIIWELKELGQNNFQVITSEYWLSNEDIALDEFSGMLSDEEINHGD
jgi:hypothetical protein